ncbi:response regulator [Pseudomonas sp. SMSB3]|uniref:response regulator n=1 Tax=unclassified Pseudomonas TaxID=196821 RepID=UPI0011A44524|nr:MULTISPECIES: response regulator [unclassified Pseudomonas]
MKTFDLAKLRPAILLVEDEPIIRELLAYALEDLGAVVTQAETAAQGLQTLQTQSFALLLTDVRTPGSLNGLELAKIAAQQFPRMKLMVTSGYYDTIHQALPEGVKFLPKPWTLESLVGAIEELLAQPAGLAMQPAA